MHHKVGSSNPDQGLTEGFSEEGLSEPCNAGWAGSAANKSNESSSMQRYKCAQKLWGEKECGQLRNHNRLV